MKIVVYGAGVMAQYVKESVINSGNEFVGFVDPLGNGDFKNLKENNVDFDAILAFWKMCWKRELIKKFQC